MEEQAELVRLEACIDLLLEQYKQLKADYQALEEMLGEQEAECGRLRDAMEEVSRERNQMNASVSRLLDRIEQWEREHLPANFREAAHSATAAASQKDEAVEE